MIRLTVGKMVRLVEEIQKRNCYRDESSLCSCANAGGRWGDVVALARSVKADLRIIRRLKKEATYAP